MVETVQARNSLDALVHSVKKSVTEYGDKVGADDKAKIEAALKDAEELLKQNDATKEQLEAKAEELAKTSQKLGEVMYAQAQAAAAASGGPGGGAGAESAGGAGAAGGHHADEKVVDAEFTEVKDQK
jgi:molecular chaperone DnaK